MKTPQAIAPVETATPAELWEAYYEDGAKIQDPDGNVFYLREDNSGCKFHEITRKDRSFVSCANPPDFNSFPNGCVVVKH